MRIGGASHSRHAPRAAVTLPREETGMIAARTPGTHFDAEEGAEGHSMPGSNSLRQVVLICGEGGCWVAECPSLPGCTGEGSTRERAIDSVKESIAGYLADLEACGLPVPEERFDALIVAV
jgi:predicted RNase H-like HicB family nuclease